MSGIVDCGEVFMRRFNTEAMCYSARVGEEVQLFAALRSTESWGQ